MNLFVDTSVWSLAWRRDRPGTSAEVELLQQALTGDDLVMSTGLVLQELLQGFAGPKQRVRILDAFLTIPLVVPDRQDHVAAADLRNHCRRKGIQVGTIDGLLAQLCIRHKFHMLSMDVDFGRIATLTPLQLARA